MDSMGIIGNGLSLMPIFAPAELCDCNWEEAAQDDWQYISTTTTTATNPYVPSSVSKLDVQVDMVETRTSTPQPSTNATADAGEAV
jgi:hypothetical protein